MKFKELSSVAGVEIQGIDLREELSPTEVGEVREAFLKAHLLLLRNQTIDAQEQARFLSHFGKLKEADGKTVVEYVSNSRDDDIAGPGRLLFHSDGCFRPNPPYGSSLISIEISDNAPTTMFANTERAYTRLTEDLKERVATLSAVHIFDFNSPDEHYRPRMPNVGLQDRDRFWFASHPVVMQLPVTKVPVLFVSEMQTSHFIGVDPDEGENLYQELLSYLYSDDNIIEHRWQQGDVIVWNNLAMQHARPDGVGEYRRELRRVQLAAA